MKTFHKKVLTYLFIFLTLYFLSIPFIANPVLRILVNILLAFLPYLTFGLYNHTKEIQFAREQLKSFLEQLCTKVSSGKSLETVFLDSRADIQLLYGKNAIMCIALKSFEDQIRSGVSFDEALLPMARLIPCPEASPLFYTISRTRNLGNRILQVLRQSLVMVSELLLVTKDISSDVSQKRLESTIMAIMPFAVLWSLELTTKEYLKPAFSKPLGALLMMFSFILAISSYCLGGFIISYSIYNKTNSHSRSQKSSLAGWLSKGFTSFIEPFPVRLILFSKLALVLPEGYRLSLTRTLSYLYPLKEHPLEENLFTKISISLLCLIVFIFLRIFIPIPLLFCFLISFFLLFLHDVDTNSSISRNKSQMMQDFPTFVGLLSTLLSNGIVLSKALIMCIETFKNSSVPFLSELKFLHGSITAGTTCYEALTAFANRCQIPEIASALNFAAQYDKTGSIENLNLLKIQCSVCWTQSKITAQKQLDESSVQLLFPMILQLICVMIITLTPSIFSLNLI